MWREHLLFIHHQWPRCFLLPPIILFSYFNAFPDIALTFQVTLDNDKSKAVDFNIIWSSSPDSLKYSSYFSKPELIEFPTDVPGQNAYAYFYKPSNPDFQASEEEKPPLLLKSHGKSWSCIRSDHILFHKSLDVENLLSGVFPLQP